jgi:hypothetical protein
MRLAISTITQLEGEIGRGAYGVVFQVRYSWSPFVFRLCTHRLGVVGALRNQGRHRGVEVWSMSNSNVPAPNQQNSRWRADRWRSSSSMSKAARRRPNTRPRYHTAIYIYIYISRERERERDCVCYRFFFFFFFNCLVVVASVARV